MPSTTPFLRTERLVLRPFQAADVDALVAYRNDPEVARLQDWDLPYPRDRAERLVAHMADLTWPAPGEWLQVAVERADAAGLIGDIGIGWAESGQRVTIGYSFAADHQGNGYATEAVGAVVERLLGEGVRRFDANTDPENVASIRVLEKLGFVYEGRMVGAALVRGEWLDDLVFGLTPERHRNWVERPRHRPHDVALVEITTETSHLYRNATTHLSQERLVSPTTKSYEHALFPELDDGGRPLVPWMRGIEADGLAVGFVMVAEATETNPHPTLWRLVIDRLHQGRGIGTEVIRRLVADLRADGHTTLLTSWVDGPGSPAPFYLGLGFRPTGKVVDDEVEAALDLRR